MYRVRERDFSIDISMSKCILCCVNFHFFSRCVNCQVEIRPYKQLHDRNQDCTLTHIPIDTHTSLIFFDNIHTCTYMVVTYSTLANGTCLCVCLTAFLLQGVVVTLVLVGAGREGERETERGRGQVELSHTSESRSLDRRASYQEP